MTGACRPTFVFFFFDFGVSSGLWVIAHECGHGAFSDYLSLNDTGVLTVDPQNICRQIMTFHSWMCPSHFFARSVLELEILSCKTS